MPYGSIDFPAQDNSLTVGSKCQVVQSNRRQSFSLINASMSILSSLSVIVFELIFDCRFSVLESLWNAVSVVDVLSATFPTVGFGDADRTFCVPS